MLQQAGVFEPAGARAATPSATAFTTRKGNEAETLFQKHCKSVAGVFISGSARGRKCSATTRRDENRPKPYFILGRRRKSLQTQIRKQNPPNTSKSPQFYIISRRFPFPNLSCAFNPPRKNNCIRVKNPSAPRENLKPITNAAGIRTYFSDSPRHLRASNAPVPAETENSLHRGK